MFVVILTYVKPMPEVEKHTLEHRAYLDIFYDHGILLMSGRQTNQNGGVIIAKVDSRAELEGILQDDPFNRAGVANYAVYEFSPTKYQPFLEDFVKHTYDPSQS